MAKRKKDTSEEVMNLSMSKNNDKVDNSISKPHEDNPFSKKVKPEIEKVKHNKNNEVLNDSDLFGNLIV
jgi:hypothetical protein